MNAETAALGTVIFMRKRKSHQECQIESGAYKIPRLIARPIPIFSRVFI